MLFIPVTKKGVAEIAHQDIIRNGKYPCTSSADENDLDEASASFEVSFLILIVQTSGIIQV
jgi:hypothetical protein